MHSVNRSYRSDFCFRIEGNSNGGAAQVQLTENHRSIEVRDIDDRQTGGVSGDIGELPPWIGRVGAELDIPRLAIQFQGRDHAGNGWAAAQRIQTLLDGGKVGDTIAVGIDLVRVRAD